MIGKSKIYYFYVLYPLALSNVGSSALEYFIGFLILKDDHYILRLKVLMNNIEFMQKHDGFHDIANNESTLKLIKKLSFSNIFVEILPVDILCDDVFMSFRVNSVDVFNHLIMVYYFHDLALITKVLKI